MLVTELGRVGWRWVSGGATRVQFEYGRSKADWTLMVGYPNMGSEGTWIGYMNFELKRRREKIKHKSL